MSEELMDVSKANRFYTAEFTLSQWDTYRKRVQRSPEVAVRIPSGKDQFTIIASDAKPFEGLTEPREILDLEAEIWTALLAGPPLVGPCSRITGVGFNPSALATCWEKVSIA